MGEAQRFVAMNSPKPKQQQHVSPITAVNYHPSSVQAVPFSQQDLNAIQNSNILCLRKSYSIDSNAPHNDRYYDFLKGSSHQLHHLSNKLSLPNLHSAEEFSNCGSSRHANYNSKFNDNMHNNIQYPRPSLNTYEL